MSDDKLTVNELGLTPLNDEEARALMNGSENNE